MRKRILLILLMLNTAPLGAATIPGQLNQTEIKRMLETLGLPSVTRFLRSAEPYPFWPGIKFGFEVLMLPGKELNNLGDQQGTIPSVNFVPRVHIVKGLFYGFEIAVNFFPLNSTNSLSTVGAALKWTAVNEDTAPYSAAPYFGVTRFTGFGGIEGTDFELGGIFSKDLVRFKPYIGGGVVFTSGKIINGLASGVDEGNISSIHFFAGTEIELPVNLTFQMDLMNLAFSATVFVGKKF